MPPTVSRHVGPEGDVRHRHRRRHPRTAAGTAAAAGTPSAPPPHGPRPRARCGRRAPPASAAICSGARRRGRRGWRPRTACGRCGRRPRPRPGPAGHGRPGHRGARRPRGLVRRRRRRRRLGIAVGESEVLRQGAQLVEHVAVLADVEVDERLPADPFVEVLGVQHGGGVLERAGAHVGLDRHLDEVLVEAVDLGLGLGLAPTGLGEVGIGLGEGPLAVGEGRLLTGHVGVQGVEGRRDLVVGGLEHVDLGCDLGLRAAGSARRSERASTGAVGAADESAGSRPSAQAPTATAAASLRIVEELRPASFVFGTVPVDPPGDGPRHRPRQDAAIGPPAALVTKP